MRRRCAPAVRDVRYEGAATARPHPEALAVLANRRLRAVVICPSNPLLSIEPIVAVAGLRDAIARCAAPVLAVSPLIGGRAVKGPTAKMMAELGLPVSAAAVAERYRDLLDGYVIDDADASYSGKFACPVTVTRTLMRTPDDQDALARHVLASADALAKAAA